MSPDTKWLEPKLMRNLNYKMLTSIESLDKARKQNVGHLCIQGDSGGETFLTCPMRFIECANENVFLLMLDIESLSQIGELSGVILNSEIPTAGYDAWIISAEFNLGETYQGGEISDDLWICDQLKDRGILEDIQSILVGKMDRLSLDGQA